MPSSSVSLTRRATLLWSSRSRRSRMRVFRIGERQADADVLDAGDQHDIARVGHFGGGALEALEGQHLVDLGAIRRRFLAREHGDVLPGAQRALVDAADADA